MIAAQTKIIECATGDFGAQAGLYSGMLLDAYQAANVQVKVSDLRAAVEKHNDDGSMDLLVAVRVLVTNSEKSDEEQGYRLRVKMARAEDGNYKVRTARPGHVVTAVLDNADPVSTTGAGAGQTRLASWPARAGAFGIDVLAPAGLIVTLALLAWSAPLYGWFWWVCTVAAAVVAAAMLVNRIGLPAFTGWSLGRSVFGIRVVSAAGDAGLLRLVAA